MGSVREEASSSCCVFQDFGNMAASSEKDNDIARQGGHASSEDEKVDFENIEDVGTQGEPRASRFTKEKEEDVIKKLDWHVMPLIFVLYSLSVLDRSNLGNAKIAGMTKDINLTGNRYAWLGTIFYISCGFYAFA